MKTRWISLIILGCLVTASQGCTLKDPVAYGDICPMAFHQDEDGVFYFPLMNDNLHCYKDHISCSDDGFKSKFKTHMDDNTFRSYSELRTDATPLYSEEQLKLLFYNPDKTNEEYLKFSIKTLGEAFTEACYEIDKESIELCLEYQSNFDDLMNNVLAEKNDKIYIEKVNKIRIKSDEYTALRDTDGNLYRCPISYPRCLFNNDNIDGKYFSCVQSCFAGQELCDGSCVDVSADNRHCGECYNACGENTKCVDGICEYDCEDCIKCGDDVKNPLTWNEHCGARGNCSSSDPNSEDYVGDVCQEDNVCANGVCKLFSCKDPETPDICYDTNKEPVCVNKSKDMNYCNCSPCRAIANSLGATCNEGVCIQLSCNSDSKALCNGEGDRLVPCADGQSPVKCAYLMGDPDYCGEEMQKCKTGQYCAAGHCIDLTDGASACGGTICSNEKDACYNGKCLTLVCKPGETACYYTDKQNTACVDTSKDPENCGFCGYRCADHDLARATSQTCENGLCVYECKSNYINAGGKHANDIICVNPLSDSEHCGKRDTPKENLLKCEDTKICVGGTCTENGCDTGQSLCLIEPETLKRCVDVSTKENCGECGNNCDTTLPANAKSIACETIEIEGEKSKFKCQYECDTSINPNIVNIGPNSNDGIQCVDSTSREHCGAVDAQNQGQPCDPLWECKDKTCVPTKESCKSQGQCLNPEGNACVAGTIDTACGESCMDCSATANTKHCQKLADAYQCVQCLKDGDCAGDTRCNTSSGYCVTCFEDKDCKNSPAGKHCDTTKNTCVQCREIGDCSGATSVCDTTTGLCVGCTSHDDCTSDNARICDISTHTCGCGIHNKTGCTPPTPYCSKEQQACGSCIDDGSCQQHTNTPHCDLNSLKCVACAKPEHCSSANPYCINNTCQECTGNDQCKTKNPSKPICSSTNQCVECASDTDCKDSVKTVCDDSHQCVECASDTDCTDSLKTVCDSTQCVECTTNGQCAEKDPTKPICSSHQCLACTNNDECSDDLTCNTTDHICECVTGSGTGCPESLVCLSGACVQCKDEGDCPYQVCDETTHECTGCTSINACSGDKPACNTTTHECVECMTDQDCTNADRLPFCLTETNSCVDCLDDKDCDPGFICTETHLCDFSEAVIDCSTNNDCSEGYICFEGKCVSSEE